MRYFKLFMKMDIYSIKVPKEICINKTLLNIIFLTRHFKIGISKITLLFAVLSYGLFLLRPTVVYICVYICRKIDRGTIFYRIACFFPNMFASRAAYLFL